MPLSGPLPNIPTLPWILAEGGALDVDLCPDCWERNAHLERYELATRVLGGMRVVDFGCGVGYGSEMLTKSGCVVVSVDSSEESLGLATQRRPEQSQFVRPGDPVLDNPFDGIVAFEVIEHLDNPGWFFEWASKRAKHIVVSVPVIPTVGVNPHHKTDFTQVSFRKMVNRYFAVESEFPQTMPFNRNPCILIIHAINRNPKNIIGSNL